MLAQAEAEEKAAEHLTEKRAFELVCLRDGGDS